MKIFYAVVLTSFTFFLFSCDKAANGSFDVKAGNIPADNIQIWDNQFFPSIDSVALGASVCFVNTTNSAHTLISDDVFSVKTPTIFPDSIYTFKIKTIGTYRYHCIEHPSISGVIIMRL